MKYIDCHLHINFPDYDSDRDSVIKKTLAEDVWMINIGTSNKTSEEVVSISNEYDKGVYSIVGIHPAEEEYDLEIIKKLTLNKKVVGIGETGLDYFRNPNKEKQVELFEGQIDIANEVKKPLMLHIRDEGGSLDAYKDTLSILKRKTKVPGNAHFFAGSIDEAKEFLSIGYNISFTGVITFTNDYDEVIEYTPIDRILSETDSPFVAPEPYRGTRNEPIYVKEVVRRISEVKGLDIEETRQILALNAKKFFTLDT